ncbi:hypothetical protein GCK32_009693 [Trichostrongylus colubriformis]|uniref:Uncharacterized protein n=1 Tax=Trichostrongylus colubriformis TaxID=6319 RepID=A0AAN8FKM8_TRICO
MENAYTKIKDQLTKAELGHPHHRECYTPGTCSNLSPGRSLRSISSWENGICMDRSPYSRSGKPRSSVASIEQRLVEMERALKRLDNIESSLAKLSIQLSHPATRSTSGPCTTFNRNLYGCHEINEIFSQTQTELQRARNAISRMLAMPAVYTMRTNADGIKDRSELDNLGKLIDRFLVKLKNSKDAYENACGDTGNCIVCNMCTSSSISRCCSLY